MSLESCHALRFLGSDVPHFQQLVARDSGHLFVRWAELQVPNPLHVPLQLHHLPEFFCAPDFDSLVLTSCGDELVVRTELGNVDALLVGHHSH